MKKFRELTTYMELAFNQAEIIFAEGNRMDLVIDGEDWEIEDIFFVLESYGATASLNLGEIIIPKKMQDFFFKLWDALWIISNLSSKDTENWLALNDNNGFFKIKLENRNKFKQLCITKIVNEVCNQVCGFSLLTVLK